jgi:hypothetical protein
MCQDPAEAGRGGKCYQKAARKNGDREAFVMLGLVCICRVAVSHIRHLYAVSIEDPKLQGYFWKLQSVLHSGFT